MRTDGSSVVDTIEPLVAPRTTPREWAGCPPLALHELEVGARAIVGGPTAYDGTVIRLLEMGLTPGTEVMLSRRAPGSHALEVIVRGTRICLRRSDAARFPVRLIGEL